MNKSQTYKAVTDKLEAVYTKSKVSKSAQEAINEIIDLYLKPKSGGGVARNVENPPKLDDNGHIVEAYCKYYKRYLPAAECNISFRGTEKEKYRGESLLGAARYREITQEINTLKQQSQDLLLAKDIEGAQKAAKEAQRLFDTRQDSSLYDYEADFKRLRAPKESTETKEEAK